MRRFIAAFAALAAIGPASAAGVPYVRCAISAYVIDQDPEGLNIRSSPSSRARIVKTVGNDRAGVAVVRGIQGGWFQISRIDDAETDEVLFQGNGWVHGSLLHVDVAAADQMLYAGPSGKARRLMKLQGDQDGVELIACKGEWAQVRVNGVLGWLSPSGQCSNPLTTCA